MNFSVGINKLCKIECRFSADLPTIVNIENIERKKNALLKHAK
jgi:hypothetical protein